MEYFYLKNSTCFKIVSFAKISRPTISLKDSTSKDSLKDESRNSGQTGVNDGGIGKTWKSHFWTKP